LKKDIDPFLGKLRTMADTEAEAAFFASMQENQDTEKDTIPPSEDDINGEQIESSDEYDPTHVVQDDLVTGSLQASHQVPDATSPVPRASSLQPPLAVETMIAQNVVSSKESSPTPQLPESDASVKARPARLSYTTTNGTIRPGSAPSELPTPTSAIPKARLPNDRIGILEDRIKEDEKGDLDAWLSLLAEYKARGKLDEARKTYDRFFKLFPSAVSTRCEVKWKVLMNS
jgi:cleavage stimulation factor subunit 3